MYTKEKFYHSISVLVSAFMNDTLMHGSCYACAVGNLVADGLGCKVQKDQRRMSWDNGMPYPGDDSNFNLIGWGGIFTTDRHSSSLFNKGSRKYQKVHLENLNAPLAQQQIKATGYHWTDLAKIENAFESVDKRRKDAMFNGIMAVVDVLCEIHGMNQMEKQEAKEMFVKV